MSDCGICRNYKECKSENKDKVDKCFFVYPTEEELAKDTKEYAIGYQQGMKDKENELKEHNVFVSNIPIEDIVLDALNDERERIISELEEKKHKVYSTYSLSENNIDLGITYGLETAIEIVKGDVNERND
jgi:hypothetical protein